MKHWKRLTALILTLVLTVSGLPVSPAALAAGGSAGADQYSARDAAPAKPTTKMRFVQTGFDPNTGILTMSLQIKPERGSNNQTVSEGMFMFQTDVDTVVPITRPRKDPRDPSDDPPPSPEILVSFGERAAVVCTQAGAPTSMQEYLESDRATLKPNITQPSGTDFAVAMSSENLTAKFTGYMVSSQQVDTGKSNLLDCYLQFYCEWGKHITPDAEGYVKVIDLDFQCYSGHEDDGSLKKATSTDCLFAGSIRVPQNQEEVNSIGSRFSYVNGSGHTVPMTMGGAGFIQKYLVGRTTREGNAYYYYSEPKITQWRSDPDPSDGYPGRASWSTVGATRISGETAPGLWYDHMEDKYMVQNLIASTDNSFTGDYIRNPSDDPSNPDDDYILDPDPDFREPVDENGIVTEAGNYPRYVIPTKEQSIANDNAGKTDSTAWIPVAYQRGVKQALKYYITTEVSESSVASPESENFDAFMAGLKWEFVLDDGTRLEDCTIEVESGSGKLIPTANGKYYRVKEATITAAPYTGHGKDMVGSKLWKVWYADDPGDPSKDRECMLSPVGVTLDMIPTQVRYEDPFTYPDSPTRPETEGPNAIAPQLHVTGDAADPLNYIWRLTSGGQVLFRPVYDPEGAALKDYWMTTRLYKEPSGIADSQFTTDNLPMVEYEKGKTMLGFWTGTKQLDGTGGEIFNDAISTGVDITSTLYDQYGVAYTDRWNTIEIVPTDATKEAMEKAKKTEVPIEVAQKAGTNEYTIKYKRGMSVNDVVEGSYILRATYNITWNKDFIKDLPIYIRKPADRLDFMDIILTAPHKTVSTKKVEETDGGKGTVIQVQYHVPEQRNNETVTKTEMLMIDELANQWRQDDNNPSAYDILLNIRDASGSRIDIDAARKKGVSIEFTVTYPDGSCPRGITVDTLNGTFTYDSTTKGTVAGTDTKGAKFNFRCTAEYKGSKRFVEYQFEFLRELSTLQKIVVYPPEGKTSYQITVPLKAESEVSQQLEVFAIDQYGSQWGWDGVAEAYAPGGRLNKEEKDWGYWKIFPVESTLKDGRLPEGVSLGNAPGDVELHNAIVTVQPAAPSSEFQVVAKFGPYTSDPVTISVTRQPSRPITVQNLVYHYEGTDKLAGTITSPNRNQAELAFTPTLEAFDQYDAAITEYETKWTLTVNTASGTAESIQEARRYVTLDDAGRLVIKSCAPECTVTVTAMVKKNGARKSTNTTLTVVRDTPRPENVVVDQTEIDYPSSNDASTSANQLTAKGDTQYGMKQEYHIDDLKWTLDKVEFADGSWVERVDSSDTETGDIPYDSTRQRYTARNSVVLTERGTLSFNSVTMLRDLPEYVTVSGWYGGTVRGQKRLHIAKDPSAADLIYIPPHDEYSNGVEKPSAGDIVIVPLEAYIRDQYGIIMTQSPSWAVIGSVPTGMKVDVKNKVVAIDHTVEPHSQVHLQAQTNLLGSGKWVDLYITARRDQPLEVGYVDATGIRDGTGKLVGFGNDVTVPLPAKTETGYGFYLMNWSIRDQYKNAISRSVSWSVESASIGGTATTASALASFTDANSGSLRVYFNESARAGLDQGKDVAVILRVASVDNPAISNTCTLHFALMDSDPAYAGAVVTGADQIDPDNGGKPIVPPKGTKANEIRIAATVYDQYGQKMPDETAEMKLITMAKGLTFKQARHTNNASLTVESNVTGTMVFIQSTPENLPDNIREESGLQIDLSKGTAYPYGLELYETNEYEIAIPYWESDQASNVPSPDKIEQHNLRAEVRDQYTAFMVIEAENGGPRPIWEFVGEHDGVEFAEYMDTTVRQTGALTLADDDADGKIQSESIVLDVSNRAVPPGQLEDTVLLKVTTSHKDGEDFEKLIKLKLTREAPVATYLYFTDSNRDGVRDPSVMRPYAETKSEVSQIEPVVYDQYGAPFVDAKIGEEIDLDLDLDSLQSEGSNILVKKLYKPGESEEKGDRPIGYEIYRVVYKDEDDDKGVRTLLAEFDRTTGALTFYTENDCKKDLTGMLFKAIYEPLGAVGNKELHVIIEEEELRPHKINLERTHGNFLIKSTEADNIVDYIRSLVYDQYGGVYNSGPYGVVWSLYLAEKDDRGNYLPYDSEEDKDGNHRAPSQFLVLKSDSGNNTTITVQPESFYENKSFVLECIVVDSRHPESSRWVYQYEFFTVRRPVANTGIPVTFDAGEYGKLVGPSEISVTSGELPLNAPGVKTVTGYGFIGWTSDGYHLVDATKIPIYSDTAYVAVYKDITNTQCLAGYKDGTVRPEAAVTRAEFTTMLVRALGGYDNTRDYGTSFPDVQKGKWYSNFVAYAKLHGIAAGYPDGTFRPDAVITRAEAARLLAAAAGLTSSRSGTFPDVRVGSWYEKSAEALHEAGALHGFSDGTFGPRRSLSRAEAVKLVVSLTVNALTPFEKKNIQEYAFCPFSDIKKGHWAYAYILRAAGIA